MIIENSDSISMREALNRPPKEGQMVPITYVYWDERLKEYEEWRVNLDGSIYLYALAKEPDLPRGYEMEPHKSWTMLNQDLLEVLKEESYKGNFQKAMQALEESEKLVAKFGDMRIQSVHNGFPEDFADETFWEYYDSIIEAREEEQGKSVLLNKTLEKLIPFNHFEVVVTKPQLVEDQEEVKSMKYKDVDEISLRVKLQPAESININLLNDQEQ